MLFYAVVGNPVKHSKSPQIHKMFAKQTDQELQYTAVEIEDVDFDEFVKDFFAEGGGGLNVTVPFKEKAFALAVDCSERACLAKAVNTLFMDGDKKLCGDNTDGIGLVRDLTVNNKVELQGKRLLLLGAGGAARGALAALVSEQALSVTIANRTLSRAEQLRDEFGDLVELQVKSFDQLGSEQFDIIINATSSSLSGETLPIDPAVIADGCCCYDMMYGAQATPFLSWAKENGARLALDGLGMLVEQAAESFALWRGVRPDTTPVIEHLINSGE